ncbi:Ser/Thr protein phosphatase [Neurospora crassa OR74A]|uniref:Ser/Thr protein phosphatase n=1 Tax=Neurospora crassa (strain ATCC 24698 / 74-OR23-1A / CBS 708.71 / DSM 1257 / FGSC 987) TaxID=367110 RepID=V5IND1_NEUCR|nr:Ser/Thr protein phosphatase [Neurospora crassa OR74A]ESA42654.1 Ser/Thr protein phosphatase [Neurospora crassa OR74A]|eukprot:XP_011394620.1 Ser/Thr protein phosphatase [Neurospora crassa OR74A]
MKSSPSDRPPTRRTRIVCISDTHNCTIKLPKGDVLIHAGDLTNQGSLSELTKAIQWLEKADFEAKVVIAGNHDKALNPAPSSESSQHQALSPESCHFHNQSLPNPKECLSLFATHGPSITYLRHESAEIKLTQPKGPRTKFKVFGSPGTPGLGEKWAFGYERDVNDPNRARYPHQENGGGRAVATEMKSGSQSNPEKETGRSDPQSHFSPISNSISAKEIWSSIPPDTDIIVTHTPPYGHCDLGVVRGSDGSDDGGSPSKTGVTGGEEAETRTETDRHLGCQSLLQRLSVVRPRLHVCGHVHRARGAERVRWSPVSSPSASVSMGMEDDGEIGWIESTTEKWTDPSPDPKSGKISLVDLTGRGRGEGSGKLDWVDVDTVIGKSTGGREGRKETCVVNCAILASNYPHVGGKRFHKPVVVDLELPVCEESQDC